MRYIQPHTPPARFPSVPFTAPFHGAFNPDEPSLEEAPGYYEALCQEEVERHLTSPCTVLIYPLIEREHPEYGLIEVRGPYAVGAITFGTVAEALASIEEAEDAPSCPYDFEVVPLALPSSGASGDEMPLADVTLSVACAGAS